MAPSRSSRLVRLVVAVAIICGLVAPAGAAVLPPGPSTTVPAPAPVDAYAAYVSQKTCDPTRKPGAEAVLKLAMDHYKIGRNTGISRSCTVGGVSEHKEGRAFDWGLRVDRPAEKAAGDAFTQWLTAAGPDGKPGYNARRLGVMYVIWNRQIWQSSSASRGWRAYSGASPHTDHVHVSLSWNGAYKRTSWWTGSLVAQLPLGNVDRIETTNTGMTVSGWGLDPDTSDPVEVHLYVDGGGRAVKADRSRPDVAAAFGRGDRHGFEIEVPARPGPHTVCPYVIDSAEPSANTPLGCRTVVVPDQLPIGAVDSVSTTPSSISVSGWTLDPDTREPTDVHVYIGGAATAVRADRSRPDVDRVFGMGDRHGYTYTRQVPAGRHTVCVYGINTAGYVNPLLGCRTVDVESAAPTGMIDAITTAPSTVTASGWTLDPDTTGPTDVEVTIDGVARTARADLPRPDVARAFGRGDRHGYSVVATVPSGRHSVCVRAMNTEPGKHTALGCRDVVVPSAAPFGMLDAVTVGAGTVSASGWVVDPDIAGPTDVRVYVDGAYATLRADVTRPDVAAAFRRSDRHGFAHTVPAAPGPHSVCAWGMDATGTEHRLLGCRSVTVLR